MHHMPRARRPHGGICQRVRRIGQDCTVTETDGFSCSRRRRQAPAPLCTRHIGILNQQGRASIRVARRRQQQRCLACVLEAEIEGCAAALPRQLRVGHTALPCLPPNPAEPHRDNSLPCRPIRPIGAPSGHTGRALALGHARCLLQALPGQRPSRSGSSGERGLQPPRPRCTAAGPETCWLGRPARLALLAGRSDHCPAARAPVLLSRSRSSSSGARLRPVRCPSTRCTLGCSSRPEPWPSCTPTSAARATCRMG